MPSGTLDPLAGESRAEKHDLGHFVLGDPKRLTGLRKKVKLLFPLSFVEWSIGREDGLSLIHI